MTRRKRTRDEIEEIVNDLGYKLLDEYIKEGSGKRYVVVEDKQGYKYDCYLPHLRDTSRHVNFVDVGNSPSLENIALWLKINKKDFKLYGDNCYTGATYNLCFYCLICTEIFFTNWNKVYSRENKCPFCSGKQVGKYNNLAYLRPDLVDEWNYEKNELKPEEVTYGSNRKVWWVCSKCEHEWESKVCNRTNGRKCPLCAKKLTESYIATELKIFCIEKYSAKDEYKICTNIDTNAFLPFDIYIPFGDNPNLNGYYIEIHGDQHYRFYHRYHRTNNGFENSKHRDKIKKSFAKENGTYIEIDLRKIKTVKDAINYILKRMSDDK